MERFDFDKFIEKHKITGDREGIDFLYWLNGSQDSCLSEIKKLRNQLLLRNKIILAQAELIAEVRLPDPNKL